MPRRKRIPEEEQVRSTPCASPPLTQEARETQLVSLAMDLAEKRLREGTASSQEIVYYLRLGSNRDKLEMGMLEAKNELLRAKTEAIKAAERTEELYAAAINAFRLYGGAGDEGEYEEDGEVDE